MINIQPYISKLDVLQEYMFKKIDGLNPYEVYMDIDVLGRIKDITPERLIKMFFETGILISRTSEEVAFKLPLTFKEYYLRHEIDADVAEMNKSKMEEKLPIIISDHAYDRGKDRLGLSRTAFQQKAIKAFKEGICHSEVAGNLKRFIDKTYLKEGNANNIRILNHFIFIFRKNILITVYQVPNNLKKSVFKIKEQKKNDTKNNI